MPAAKTGKSVVPPNKPLHQALHRVLGEDGVSTFLSEYWQQQPLLIPDALPGFESMLTVDEVAGLAMEAEVESRLVLEKSHTQDKYWQVMHGPFDESQLTGLPENHWNLLVQAVDLWVPEIKALLTYFDFLPPWRLDDIMVSCGPKGSSVGPHFDYYDVFLLQGAGQKQWQLGQQCDNRSPLLPNADLRVLTTFDTKSSWVLNPGDILYVPPQVAHWGVGQNTNITYSVGFRSPTLADMLSDLATELTVQDRDSHYRDPPLTVEMASPHIDPAFIQQIKHMLHTLADDEELLADWFARFVSAPKYPEWVDEADGDREVEANGKYYLNGEQLPPQ